MPTARSPNTQGSNSLLDGTPFITIVVEFDSSTKMSAMGILSWILFGLIAGAIAKALHRGKDPGGWIVTIIIGILGAFVGGAIGHYVLGWEDEAGWNFKSFLLAVLGAVLLLWLYRRFSTNRRVHT
jgi:uncharacterized membrane protein YeaQ/YmgE (transglycosylase-associated protein family)